jgi:hypothetical protein
MSYFRRISLLLALVALLAAPATALPLKRSVPEPASAISWFQDLWQRLTQPALSLLGVGGTYDEQRGIWDPHGEPAPVSSLALEPALEPQDDAL